MKKLVSYSLFFLPILLYSQQKANNIWLFGEGYTESSIVDFSSGKPEVINLNIPLGMQAANAAISDANGDLLFYTQGCHVFNKEFEIMQNGDSISNMGGLHNFTCRSGSILPQSVMILPNPDDACRYFVLHTDLITSARTEANIYYSIVDMTKDEGKGAVILKDEIIVADSLDYGLTATPHANGHDWWIVHPRMNSNCYFIMLLTADGVEFKDMQCLGYERKYPITSGAVTFSPDGKTYANFHFLRGLTLLDFDNETGTFIDSEHLEFDFTDTSYFNGVAISPNSQFLYATTNEKIFQLDLLAEDLRESRVEVAELIDVSDSIRFRTRFHMMVTGPDEKIYIGGTNQYNHLHTIHFPDRKGVACEVEQYAVELDTFPSFSSWGVPNIPHFPKNFEVGLCDSVTVSTTDHQDKIKVEVFPNPVGDMLNIRIEPRDIASTLTVFDLIGELKKEIVLDQNNQINISGLNPGIYFFQIQSKGQILLSDKLIIKR